MVDVVIVLECMRDIPPSERGERQRSRYSGTEGNILFWNWIFPKASVVSGSWARTGSASICVSSLRPGKAGEMTGSEQPGQDKREDTG